MKAGSSRLRVAIHDYGGYPFIVQLSRALAGRGHEILHLYASGFRTPKGPMEPQSNDAATLSIEPVTLNESLQRGGIKRIGQERRYSRLLSTRIRAWRPDVVISANTPLEVQKVAQAASHDAGAAFVFWLQDLHSIAISRILGRRFRTAGSLVGAFFARIEQRLLRRSESVVVISPDYLGALRQWKLPMGSVEVIENWAPLERAGQSEVTAWATSQDIADETVVLYAGTLALKHNPALLLELARGLPDARVVVAAEGPGTEWLRAAGANSPNLCVLPLQPYDVVPAMLARADLLVAILEPDASTFSAPSKVLTYLAAGRAIVAAIPHDNAASRLIAKTGAGTVVEPTDPAGLVAAARELLADPERLSAAGAKGRMFATETFDIARIADRFESVLSSSVGRKSGARSAVGADTGQTSDTSHESSN